MYTTQSHHLGRLVMVVEPRLSDASRYALRMLLEDLDPEDVTMVTTLGRTATMDVEGEGERIFYNTREHLPLGTACGLMPWREMWLVANGRVWKATPYTPDDVLMAND